MDIFREHGIPHLDLCQLNRCRLYLRVARVFDITNIAREYVYAHVMSLDRDSSPLTHPIYPTSKLHWSRQPQPGTKLRQLWARTLKQTPIQTETHLQHPLGQWMIPVHDRDRRYPTLYHEHKKTLHQSDASIYQQQPVTSRTRRVLRAMLDDPVPSQSTPGLPVNVIHIHDNLLTARYIPAKSKAATHHHYHFPPQVPTYSNVGR
jgi:hypothetical protein